MRIEFVRTSRWAGALAALIAGSVMFAACAGSGGDNAAALAEATVTSGSRSSSIFKNRFETPMRVTVGSTVTWVNDDAVAHNVIGKDGAPFKSGTLDKGDRFEYEFTSPGLFKYTCTFHPGMDGVIQVE